MTLQGGEHEELQRWIIEARDAAVDKSAIQDRAVVGLDHDFLRREISRATALARITYVSRKPPSWTTYFQCPPLSRGQGLPVSSRLVIIMRPVRILALSAQSCLSSSA
jgi:hypothetical protein